MFDRALAELRRAVLALGAGLLLLVGARAQAGDCTPSWQPTFGELPGMDEAVYASAVFDDGRGGGPRLYVAGEFTLAGSEPIDRIARLDGSGWSPLGEGLNGTARALAIFDDGSGPALYAGGGFTLAGGVSALGIARWDGVQWSDVGGGVSGGVGTPTVLALAVHDDGRGGGPALYAGGTFTTAGTEPALNIARWDGVSWSSVGPGLDKIVHALAVYDAPGGGGPTLIAGGAFTVAGAKIAQWNGASWESMDSQMTGIADRVRALAVFDAGTGPKLYVGGDFDNAGGLSCNGIATWDGTSWGSVLGGMTKVGTVADPSVNALRVASVGGGAPALYAAGDFDTAGGVTAYDVARWNGTSWSALGGGLRGFPFEHADTLVAFNDGGGESLYVGGLFNQAGSTAALNLARWSGTSWSQVVPVATGGLNDSVYTLAAFDDGLGGGLALYAGGMFSCSGSTALNHVAKWTGSQWSPLGSGTSGVYGYFGPTGSVERLVVFDGDLIAGGSFLDAGGAPNTADLARWDGTTWSALVPSLPYTDVSELEVADLGDGRKLYISGHSTTVDLAIWDGSTLTTFSDGSGCGSSSVDFEVFDDGSGGGPALYACGGCYSVNPFDTPQVARWNGTGWSALGDGAGGYLYDFLTSLAVFDDGQGGGPALYVAGSFEVASRVVVHNIARWDGTTWSSVGDGTNGAISRLLVFDDGSGGGPALFAGGGFTEAGHTQVNGLAKWNGTSWSAVGGGAPLMGIDLGDGNGPALYASGGFVVAPDSSDAYLARWATCPATPSPWTHLGYALAGVDGPPLLAGTGPLTTGSAGTLKLTHAKPFAFSILFASLTGVGAGFKCGTLVPVPVQQQFAVFTNGSGALPLGWASWPAGLSGLSLYLQYAIQDPAASCGVALSNALRADVP